jgi:cbb3-type cytochrome oxidase maturation protein
VRARISSTGRGDIGVEGMDIVFLLVPISLVFAFLIGAVFWFSLKSGQFEDLDGPAYRVLMDDDKPHER